MASLINCLILIFCFDVVFYLNLSNAGGILKISAKNGNKNINKIKIPTRQLETAPTTTTSKGQMSIFNCYLESVCQTIILFCSCIQLTFVRKGQLWQWDDCSPSETGCILISLPLGAATSSETQTICCSSPQTGIS